MVEDAVAFGSAFRLVSAAHARCFRQFGIEVGLHTHRHRFPVDDLDACRRELRDNREYLASEVGVHPRHFCYPSGIHAPVHWAVLEEEGVATATTCQAGLATAAHQRYDLPRFLDGENVSDLAFQAELSGLPDLLRLLLRPRRREDVQQK
jgi:peptidoglycan/xylan/chitin deacetylase (PgdA/CDA1 family)